MTQHLDGSLKAEPAFGRDWARIRKKIMIQDGKKSELKCLNLAKPSLEGVQKTEGEDLTPRESVPHLQLYVPG
jgi:hypothetical protein